MSPDPDRQATGPGRCRRPRRVSFAGAALVALFAAAFPALNLGAAPANPAGWAQFRFGPTHTGEQPNETTLSATTASRLQVAWARQTNPGGFGIISSPAVVGGAVYYVDEGGFLISRNAGSGDLRWKSAFLGFVPVQSPAVSGGLVYIGTLDARIYAINTSTGAQVWQAHMGANASASPVVAGGFVYDADYSGSVWSFNATTGAPNPSWGGGTGSVQPDTAGGLPFLASPTVDSAAAALYIGEGDLFGPRASSLFALSTSDGSTLWSHAFPAGGTQTNHGAILSTAAATGGRVYVPVTYLTSAAGNTDEVIDAFTAAGTPVWSVDLHQDSPGTPYVPSSPAVANGVLYIGDQFELVAIVASPAASNDGSLLWRHDIEAGNPTIAIDGISPTSPAVANGVVYITGHGATGTAQGVLEARNAQSGGLIFHAALPDYVFSSPAVASGRVYFGTANNGSGPAVLYAYKVGPAPTQDPSGT